MNVLCTCTFHTEGVSEWWRPVVHVTIATSQGFLHVKKLIEQSSFVCPNCVSVSLFCSLQKMNRTAGLIQVFKLCLHFVHLSFIFDVDVVWYVDVSLWNTAHIKSKTEHIVYDLNQPDPLWLPASWFYLLRLMWSLCVIHATFHIGAAQFYTSGMLLKHTCASPAVNLHTDFSGHTLLFV